MKMKSLLLPVCLIATVLAAPCVVRKGNPDERGPYFQGDIKGKLPFMLKNGLIDDAFKWPGGVVPFVITDTISAEQETIIRSAMADYERLTNGCIRFVDRDDEKDYVRFINEESGCWSEIGRQGGPQGINYSNHCTDYYGSVLHEMLHALGFFHEHSSSNRDDYVIIKWINIDKGYEHNFDKYNNTYITDFGYPYDYESVMHYSAFAFTNYGSMTIVTKDPDYQFVIGQRRRLSDIDLKKLLAMYNCQDSN